ncbi:MAG: O-antigen ligase family protein, partial [bacterium]
ILYNLIRQSEIDDIQNYQRLIILTGFLLSVYSIYQYIGWFHPLPFTDVFRNANTYIIYRSIGSEGWGGLPRISAVAPEPSFWAAYIMIPISLAIPYLFRKGHWLYKLIFIFLNISMFLTVSRVGWFSYGILVCLYFLSMKRQRYRIISLVMLLITMFLIIFSFSGGLSELLRKLYRFQDISALERVSSQLTSLNIFINNLIWGVGFGNYEFVAKDYLVDFKGFISGYGGSFFVTHNLYLRIMAETGILGIILFILFLNNVWEKIKYSQKLSVSEEVGALISGLKLSFWSILIVWLNISVYNFSYIWFIFALICALPKILDKEKAK